MLSKEKGTSWPKVIAFVGLVGGGKSTHIGLLASRFSDNKLKVKTASLKTNHFFASVLTIILGKILVRKRKDVYCLRALLEDKPRVFRRLFKLWLYLDFISVSLQYLLTIYLPLIVGYAVLVEEYIPATIADYIYISKAMGMSSRTFAFQLNFMLKLMHLGGPTQVIYLDADAGSLRFRWRCRGSLNEKADYLHIQRSTLLSLSKQLSSPELVYVDTTNKTIKETHDVIASYLMKS